MLSNTRSNKHSNEDRLDAVFRALSDRTRRALLANLARGPAMVGELAAPFDMSLPAVSRHIRVLEDAKLIVRAVDGRVHRCSLTSTSSSNSSPGGTQEASPIKITNRMLLTPMYSVVRQLRSNASRISA
jgi:DNA-binding transcriptional ArsR family regulator